MKGYFRRYDFFSHCKYLISLWAGIPFVGDIVSGLCVLFKHDPVYSIGVPTSTASILTLILVVMQVELQVKRKEHINIYLRFVFLILDITSRFVTETYNELHRKSSR